MLFLSVKKLKRNLIINYKSFVVEILDCTLPVARVKNFSISAFNMQCYIVKNTLLHTAFSAKLEETSDK